MVCFDPCASTDRLRRIASRLNLSGSERIDILAAEVFVHPVAEADVARIANRMEPKNFGYVVAWDGHRL